MIVNKGEIFETAPGQFYITQQYVNTDVETWEVPCNIYGTDFLMTRIHTSKFTKVYTKKEHPEMYV